jgi:hypothetical protein
MAATVLPGKAHGFCFGAEFLTDHALLLDDQIAALPQSEGLFEQAEVIEFCAGWMLEGLEPSREQEIRHFNPVDQEGILLDGVAHLIGIFRAVARLRPEICDWIDDHLEQFMAGGDADELLVGEGGLDEDLRERLAVLGQIVIAQRAGNVGVVEIDELPIRRLGFFGIVELYWIAPDWQEILVERRC